VVIFACLVKVDVAQVDVRPLAREFPHSLSSPIEKQAFAVTSSPFISFVVRDISRKGNRFVNSFPHMAMQDPKIRPKNHKHWEPSAQGIALRNPK
jgi:hypothetical protein